MTEINQDQLHRILLSVEKPARYVGGEFNQVVKPEGAVRVRMALAFPDTYEIGISYHGYRILYERLNACDGWAAERAYAPWVDFEAAMRAADIPLYALESRRPLATFDVIAFTLQSEVNYTNVVNMLDLAGLPVRAADRSAAFPLVIAGGEGAMAPEPMSDFIDCFAIGDGEDLVLEIMAVVDAFKAEGGDSKADLLDRLANVSGIYIPSRLQFNYDAAGLIESVTDGEGNPAAPVHRRVWDLNEDIGVTRPLAPNMRAVHDRHVVEIRRGCARGCRFCHAGMTNRPVRERRPDQILEAARIGLEASGFGDLALLSLSSTDHTCIGDLVRDLVAEYRPQNIAVSLPSLRANSFDIALASEIMKVRKTGITFAPEAATERLRSVINKELDEDGFLETLRQVFEAGWTTLKLYFMVGLPTEDDADLEAIVALAQAIERMGRPIGRGRLKINITLSPFIPKPHTPFQWAAQISPDEIARRVGIVRDGLRGRKIFDIKHTNTGQALVEAALARGDRRVGRAIEAAWRAGARFDGWSDQFDLDRWIRAFESAGLDIHHLARRERSEDEILPWDHIDVRVGKPFLLKDWARARAAELVEDCARGRCAGCDACRDSEGHRLAQPYQEPLAGQTVRSAPLPTGSPKARPRPPKRQAPPPTVRLRLTFEKRQSLRYLSHLDLAAVLTATITRAQLPMAWTLGFHPHPMITLPPALSLGFGALGEPFEISLTRPVDLKDTLSALNAHAPEGLAFTSADLVSIQTTPLSKRLNAAVYRIELIDGFLEPAAARECCERFERAREWLITKKTKRGEREVNLKQSIHISEFTSAGIQMIISLAQEKYIDPLNALRAILDRDIQPADCRAVTRLQVILTD